MKIRSVLCIAGLCASTFALVAQTSPAAVPGTLVPPPPPAAVAPLPKPDATLILWPGGAPGALGTDDTDIPKLLVYLPKENTTHMGVIIAPGGGYQHLSMAKEGTDVAQWLNAHGIAAFVLQYRLGPRYHHPIELGDAQRALRLVRSRSAEYGIDKLGMIGFSAGGHLTATAGTHFDAGDPAATDSIERQTSRPDFIILCYAVVSLQKPYAHPGSLKALVGENPDLATVDLLSNELHVTPQTPPTFIYATTDDKTVPIINSVLLYEALVKANVPVEMHLFQHGPHGTGLAQSYPALRIWPDLLWTWLQSR
jgi:acetyl esterase/lipase